MEEVTSKETTKKTETGETKTEKPKSTTENEEKEKSSLDDKKPDIKDEPNVTRADSNNDEEFEQISDGTFEVDENSQATSTGGTGVDNNSGRNSKSIEEEGAADHDFEAVDANISANSTGAAVSESDALGESDMTLPKEEEDDNAHDEQSINAMEVDEEPTAEDVENIIEETDENDAAGDEEMDATNDESELVEKLEDDSIDKSGAEEFLDESVVNESEKAAEDESDEKKATESDKQQVEDETEAEAADEQEKEQDNEMEQDEEDAEAEADAEVEQEAEGEGEAEAEAELEAEAEEEADGAEVDSGNGNEEKEKGESELMETEADKSKESEDKNSSDRNGEEDEDDVDNALEESGERDGETVEETEPDQPVENVQEPEESDICLIPDDTETQVTEAEKEQAILARENAEKEADAAEAEAVKEKNNEAAKSTTDDAEDADEMSNANADDGVAQAASAAVVTGSEETPLSTDIEAVDPDEPLLEELQSSTTDSGASSKTIISWIVASVAKCSQCQEEKSCGYRFKTSESSDSGEKIEYLCDQTCCGEFVNAQPGKYFVRRKKFLVEEIPNENVAASTHDCLQCKETKACKYFFKQDDECFYVCNDDCFNLLSAEEHEKFKLKRHSIRVRNIGATISSKTTTANSSSSSSKKAAVTAESQVVARTAAEAEAARLDRAASFTRSCAECFNEVVLGEKNLVWETMDFCNEICLGKYQRNIGSSCQTCHGDVPHQALGKYCVRFGFDIRQFCCATCLNEFKKGLKTCSCCQKDISSGGEGFLAPVGDKEQFKDFCSQACMRRYDCMCNPKRKARTDTCAVCNNDKPVRVEIIVEDKEQTFCSNPCFSAFKFVSNIIADQCGMCNKYFERKSAEAFTINTDRRPKVFCSRICLNVFIIANRRIVSCQWCKVKKYNFDMIYKQHESQEVLMCSLNCLTLYGVSINAFSRTVAKCDNCNASSTPQYHLTMSDASMRNFCTYQCVMQFQSQFARAPLTLESESSTSNAKQSSTTNNSSANKSNAPFPTGLPKRVKLKANQQQQKGIESKSTHGINQKSSSTLPVISAVSSLASGETMIGNITVRRSRVRGARKLDTPPPLTRIASPPSSTGMSGRGRPRKNIDYGLPASPAATTPPALPTSNSTGKRGSSNASTNSIPAIGTGKVHTETKIIAVPPYPPAVRNVQTNCKPQTVTVGFQSEPETATVGVQTEKDYSNKILIPVPVPIYVPQPMYMYSAPFPVPVPIPLPIPVPIFIPTTRNSAQGIMKEIKKIQDKMPADPYEAELLMMAEMVAEAKHVSDSDSDEEIKPDPSIVTLQYQNSIQQQQQATDEVPNNTFGEDALQIAIKMATGDYDHPQTLSTVDLESAITNTITNPPAGIGVVHDSSLTHLNTTHHLQPAHHILETQRPGRGRKRGALSASPVSPRNNRSPVKRQRLQDLEPTSTPEPVQPLEKPDANMCLKYTFGVNAWKQWVMTKNADLEKSSMRKRLFKTELLQMTADELNYSLCLFVKEVRKPNGTEYAPDTIYYLVLGIQQYLYENGRIDNIFTDPYYERFTDCLDEVARKFSVLYNDSQYIVTRVEEEHLWECKQLGAHSPHVLLSTLMFFNTKHFNLTTVEEHMQLSFSHIMKHWKRSAQSAKTPGTRNVLLRFYPPQAGLEANPRKKKVYEQQENEDNPLRCPVRLYEFYLSKCPESVKTRNDVFYLQPERSCVPDSPVWYSTQALSQDALQKMLHRVKMVKEINIALLTS